MSRSDRHVDHLSDERIQDWLDGRLAASETGRIEEHLDHCPRCRAEVEGWQAMMGELAGLEEIAPPAGFSGRVLDAMAARTAAPAPAPLAARVGAWLRGLRADPLAHPAPELLQDFVDGALARRRAGAIRGHLSGCATCRAEAQRWAALADGLAALPRLAPSAGFAHAVMREVRLAPTPARPALRRLLDRVRALQPGAPSRAVGRRRAWAAAAGVAFTPVVTVGLIAHTVFSHPLATAGNLAAFAWLKGTALVAAAGGGLATGLIESASVFRAWSAMETLSPATAGAALLAVCAMTMASGWVLYRNVITPAVEVARVRR